MTSMPPPEGTLIVATAFGGAWLAVDLEDAGFRTFVLSPGSELAAADPPPGIEWGTIPPAPWDGVRETRRPGEGADLGALL